MEISWFQFLSVSISMTGLLIVIVGAIVGGFRNLSAKISRSDETLSAKISKGDDTLRSEHAELHKRINSVRDQFVRRDDMDKLLDPIHEDLREVKKMLNQLVMRGNGK